MPPTYTVKNVRRSVDILRTFCGEFSVFFNGTGSVYVCHVGARALSFRRFKNTQTCAELVPLSWYSTTPTSTSSPTSSRGSSRQCRRVVQLANRNNFRKSRVSDVSAMILGRIIIIYLLNQHQTFMYSNAI